MLTDRYELPLSTESPAARDAYVEGCAAKLTMYPGAIKGFDRAIAADPGFALVPAVQPQLRPGGGGEGKARICGDGTRVDGGGQIPSRRSVRAGSQPYRIFRPAFGGRGRSRTLRIAGAPERLATRRPGTRHHRVHQRPHWQFRPRRAETRAAGPAGRSC